MEPFHFMLFAFPLSQQTTNARPEEQKKTPAWIISLQPWANINKRDEFAGQWCFRYKNPSLAMRFWLKFCCATRTRRHGAVFIVVSPGKWYIITLARCCVLANCLVLLRFMSSFYGALHGAFTTNRVECEVAWTLLAVERCLTDSVFHLLCHVVSFDE